MLPLSKEKGKNLELAKKNQSFNIVFLENLKTKSVRFSSTFFKKKEKKIHKKQKLTHKDMAYKQNISI